MTQQQRALPRRTALFYASASISGNAVSQTFALWLIYFYAPPSEASITARIPEMLGLSPRVLLGILLTAMRLVEALDDPLIGYWTDRTSSRWGRRAPFILFATPLWALFFILLFLPPFEGDSSGNVAWVAIIAICFFASSNLAGAPIEALLPHIARTRDERLAVGSYQVLFALGGALLGLTVTGIIKDAAGFGVMAATVALIAAVARYTALAGAWRHAITDATPAPPGLWRSITQTLSNPQFIAYLPSFVLFQVGLQLLTALLPFHVEEVLAGESFAGLEVDDATGAFTSILTGLVLLAMVMALPFFRRLGHFRGKAAAYRAAMLAASLLFPLVFFAGFLPAIPEFYQTAVIVFIVGIPLAGVFLFPNIITADIVDFDATRTGARREALFYGTQNLLEKFATAFAPLIFALVLLAGDSSEDPLGLRLVGPVAGLLVFLGFLGFRRYSLRDDNPADR